MTKEQTLKLMQDHILQLKALSDKAKLIRAELLKLSPEDSKWYEKEFSKWLMENGFGK